MTADRVEDRVEERVFESQLVLEQYEGTVWAFYLTDLLNGTIELNGGYDATFVDGDGMLFNIARRNSATQFC